MTRQMFHITASELSYNLACLRYTLTNGTRPAHKILVNGSPKTGTTWVVKMLASLPGYHSIGNFQRNIERYRQVQPGSVIHGHEPYSAELWQVLESNGIQVVLTMRDPRDQLVSRMYHIRRDTSHPWHSELRQASDAEALMACIEGRPDLPSVAQMLRITQSWLDAGEKAIVVKYEMLLQNPEGELSKLLQRLGITAHDTLVEAVVERNQFERLSVGRKLWKRARKPGEEDNQSHFRKGIAGDWRNHLAEAHITKLKASIGDVLIAWGYEEDESWSL